MKLASLIATAVAALVMTAAISEPAAACKWKRAGIHGYKADAGWKHHRHHRHWKHHKRFRHG